MGPIYTPSNVPAGPLPTIASFTASAKTGRHVARLLTEAIVLDDRMSNRIPTAELNRFLAEAIQARQPPVGTRRGSSQHRLKLRPISAELVGSVLP